MQNKNTSKNGNMSEKRPMPVLFISVGVCKRKGEKSK